VGARSSRGEKFDGAIFGAECQGTERLSPDSGPKVECVVLEDGKIVRRLACPLEAELRRLCHRLRVINDVGKGVGKAQKSSQHYSAMGLSLTEIVRRTYLFLAWRMRSCQGGRYSIGVGCNSQGA
jgi:hypothetical protein